MRPRPRIDVSALPTTVFGPKAPLWWGAAGLLSIETTLFALMFATYYYLRGNESVWPPGGGSHGGPPIGPATVGLFLLLAGLLALVARVAEFGELPFRWDHHAYGSVVWTLIGLHAIHLLTASIENVMFVTLLFKGPVEEKHLLDLRLNAGYWYFVVGWWVVTYAVIYLDPGVFRT
jgi:cytochrome c oxidase subunit 3